VTPAGAVGDTAVGGAAAAAGTAVEVRDLVKRYPKRSDNAVDGVSFAVATGEIFGLLGPNGAGKTTTIGVLTTRVAPTSGHALVAGVDVAQDPVRARSVLAVVPQRSNLDRSLNARQNLLLHAAYHGMGRAERGRRADELLDRMGLADRGRDKVDGYSGGMAQRLLIARALMHRPAVLFLDEPSTGLDPQARLFVWDEVRALREAGTTVVVTTHDMEEAGQISDRVGIMDHGRLLALDTPAALTSAMPGEATADLGVDLPEHLDRAGLLAALDDLDGVRRVEEVVGEAEADLRLRLYVEVAAARVLGPAAEAVERVGARLLTVALGEPTLEDVFISLTGRELR